MTEREWTAYCDEDGDPWAVFVHGHVDLRVIRSKACRAEMKKAFEKFIGGDAEEWFDHELKIGHWWIYDAFSEEEDGADPDKPWRFCNKGTAGAVPITGAKFKGRGVNPRGSRHGCAKLTESDVLAIRSAEGIKQKDLAARYGVTQAQVSLIRLGKNWKHL